MVRIGNSPIAIDETLYAYHVTAKVRDFYDQMGWPYPKVYIKRKPHPNGMESVSAGTMVEYEDKTLPYIVDIAPYIFTPQPSATASVAKLNRSLDLRSSLQIMDKRFGTMDNIDKLMRSGVPFLIAIKEKNLDPDLVTVRIYYFFLVTT